MGTMNSKDFDEYEAHRAAEENWIQESDLFDIAKKNKELAERDLVKKRRVSALRAIEWINYTGLGVAFNRDQIENGYGLVYWDVFLMMIENNADTVIFKEISPKTTSVNFPNCLTWNTVYKEL